MVLRRLTAWAQIDSREQNFDTVVAAHSQPKTLSHASVPLRLHRVGVWALGLFSDSYGMSPSKCLASRPPHSSSQPAPLSWPPLTSRSVELALSMALSGATPAANMLANHLPHLPTRKEIRGRAAAMFAKTSSMDDIVDAAHMLIPRCHRGWAMPEGAEPALKPAPQEPRASKRASEENGARVGRPRP